ncbi:MAG: DNA photolyase [Deltaproteobacteria bacterium]|nr:DNA photolyase [Deltaproteobacteria bacterium]
MEIKAEREFASHPLLKGRTAEFFDSIPPSAWPLHPKGSLLIVRHRGSFLRPCPATPRHTCCGLNIFHFGQGCPFGCSYCVLEAYLGSGALVIFGNVEDGLRELEERLGPGGNPLPGENPILGESPILGENPGPALGDLEKKTPGSLRYSTGEFADSLLFDRETGLAERLVEIFARQKRAVLELKSKNADVGHLLDLPHKGRSVFSFSVNAPRISLIHESGASPLKERIEAAGRLSDRGWRVGFHFDPVVCFPGWEREYRLTVDSIFRRVDPGSIAWISLGCFRYLPALKKERLALSPDLFTPEFVRAADGKARYPRPLRLKMYRLLLDALSPRLGPETIVYLCMESGAVWRELFGRDPGTEGLAALFGRAPEARPEENEA